MRQLGPDFPLRYKAGRLRLALGGKAALVPGRGIEPDHKLRVLISSLREPEEIKGDNTWP